MYLHAGYETGESCEIMKNNRDSTFPIAFITTKPKYTQKYLR